MKEGQQRAVSPRTWGQHRRGSTMMVGMAMVIGVGGSSPALGADKPPDAPALLAIARQNEQLHAQIFQHGEKVRERWLALRRVFLTSPQRESDQAGAVQQLQGLKRDQQLLLRMVRQWVHLAPSAEEIAAMRAWLGNLRALCWILDPGEVVTAWGKAGLAAGLAGTPEPSRSPSPASSEGSARSASPRSPEPVVADMGLADIFMRDASGRVPWLIPSEEGIFMADFSHYLSINAKLFFLRQVEHELELGLQTTDRAMARLFPSVQLSAADKQRLRVGLQQIMEKSSGGASSPEELGLANFQQGKQECWAYVFGYLYHHPEAKIRQIMQYYFVSPEETQEAFAPRGGRPLPGKALTLPGEPDFSKAFYRAWNESYEEFAPAATRKQDIEQVFSTVYTLSRKLGEAYAGTSKSNEDYLRPLLRVLWAQKNPLELPRAQQMDERVARARHRLALWTVRPFWTRDFLQKIDAFLLQAPPEALLVTTRELRVGLLRFVEQMETLSAIEATWMYSPDFAALANGSGSSVSRSEESAFPRESIGEQSLRNEERAAEESAVRSSESVSSGGSTEGREGFSHPQGL